MSDSDSNKPLKNLRMEVRSSQLIELVRQNGCLWDRSAPEYRNRVAKDKAWHAIFTEFRPDYDTLSPGQKHQIGTFITKKWCNIRDSYVKSRKPIRTSKRPYIHSEQMKFLDPSIFWDSSAKKRAQDDEEDRISVEEDNETEEQVSWIDEVFVDSDMNVEDHDISPKRIKLEPREFPKGVPDTDNIVGFLANLIQKEDDEDRAFFKSITPTVKGLSENLKLEFRILVIKLLKNLKMRDRQKVTLKREKIPNIDSESE